MQRSVTRSKSAGDGAFLFAEGNFDMPGMVHILSSASSAQQHAVNFVQNQNNMNYSLFLSVCFLAVPDISITIYYYILKRQAFCLLAMLVFKRIKLIYF